MTSIITNNGLGLFNSSLDLLGTQGQLGQSASGQGGVHSYVNAATGNLVLQGQDELLVGRGLDTPLLRTYNSFGKASDVGSDLWQFSLECSVTLSGTRNTAGSSLTRRAGDGSETVYSFDSATGYYLSTDGAGAHDSLCWQAASSEWLWTDETRRVKEYYSGASGLLLRRADSDGNTSSFVYGAGDRLERIDDASGQKTHFMYSASTGRLTGVAVETDNTTRTQVQYDYFEDGRLKSVRHDLTPSDSTIADGQYYEVSYTYATYGTETFLKTVTQQDGTSLSFDYVQYTDGKYRIQRVTDGAGRYTKFSYDLALRHTTISDNLNNSWIYVYDSQNRLSEIQAPPVKGQRAISRFEYNANGDVIGITDARAKRVTYGYDERGNRTLERDAAGYTLTRTFSATNQVLTEARYLVADPDGDGAAQPGSALITYYAYDSEDHLRFTVSPEGRVAEFRYAATGELTREIRYTSIRYIGSSFAENDLAAWVSAPSTDRSKTELICHTYDARGQRESTYRYGTVNAAGDGMEASDTVKTQYVYDPFGALVSRTEHHGTTQLTTSYTYDGLGRLLTTSDAIGTTTTTYDDANNTIKVTSANQLSTSQVFDKGGQLLSVAQNAAGEVERKTCYYYDASGRLRAVQDALGARSYQFYDAAGRLSAKVDATGSVIEFVYDDNGRVLEEIRRATAVDTSAWFNADTKTVTVSDFATVRPVVSADDRKTSNTYDDAGRLTSTKVAGQTPVITEYDGASRIIRIVQGDRVTRYYYDNDGRQVGVLDPEGYLTETVYDAAGNVTETIHYSEKRIVANEPIWITPSAPRAKSGQAYDFIVPAAVDPESREIRYSLVSSTAGSGLSFNAATRSLCGTPTVVGTYYFTVRATAGAKYKDVTFAITVSEADNKTPITNNDTVATPINTAIDINVLANDSDPDGDTLSVTHAKLYSGDGTVSINPDMTLRYTPSSGFTGAAVVHYAIRDNKGAFASGIVTVFVVAENLAPVWPSVTLPTATIGATYSFIVPEASDPDGHSLSYSVVSGLPANGLSFNASTRTLSGTPTASGVLTITLRATDNGSPQKSADVSFILTVNAANQTPIPGPDEFSVTEDSYLDGTVVANDTGLGDGPVVWFVGGNAPTGGTSITSATTAQGGTFWLNVNGNFTYRPKPDFHGTDSVTYKVKDGDGELGTATVTFLVNKAANQAPTWTLPAPPEGKAGVVYEWTLPAAVDPEGESMSYALVDGLPPGLSFDASSRRIAGRPTQAGRYTLTLRATDTAGQSVEVTASLVVNVNQAPTWTLRTPPEGKAGVVYEWTLPAAVDPEGESMSYVLVDGLPPGLVFEADTRRISGRPTQAGRYTLTLRATDTAGQSVKASVTLFVNANQAPAWSLSTLPAGQEDAAYSVSLVAAIDPDGDPVTYQLAGGLPQGLSFDATSLRLSGTPRETGQFTVVLRALDNAGAFTEAKLALTIAAVNRAPQWLAGDTSAQMRFNVEVEDSTEATPNIAFRWPEWPNAEPPIHSYKLIGYHPYTGPKPEGAGEYWELAHNAEAQVYPDGKRLRVATSGGYYRLPGEYRFQIRGYDANGTLVHRSDNFTLALSGPRNSSSSVSVRYRAAGVVPPIAVTGQTYTYQIPAAFDAEGQALTYSLVGQLPAGLSFNAATRTLSGTPLSIGQHTLTVRVTDGLSAPVEQTVELVVSDKPNQAPQWSAVTPPIAYRDLAYSWALPVAQDPENQRLSYEAVGLPGWLRYDVASHTLIGTPSALGTHNFRLRAIDPHGMASEFSVDLTVKELDRPPRWVSGNTTLDILGQYSAEAGSAPNLSLSFAEPVNAEPAVARYDIVALLPFAGNDRPGEFWELARRAEPIGLPDGCRLRNALFQGYHSLPGTYRFQIRAYGADSRLLHQSEVFSAELTSASSGRWTTRWSYGARELSLPQAERGKAYSYTLPAAWDAEGQVVRYSVTGTLPEGLSFDPQTRLLSGTPTVAGRYPLTFRATDSAGGYTDIVQELLVALPNQAPTWAGLPDQVVIAGRVLDYTVPAAVDPESQALTYAVVGTLPSGLSFDPATRRLTGTPSNAGTYTLSFKATDSQWASVTTSSRLTVKPADTAPQWLEGASTVGMYVETRSEAGSQPNVFVRFPRLVHSAMAISKYRVYTWLPSSTQSSGYVEISATASTGIYSEAYFAGYHRVPGSYRFQIRAYDAANKELTRSSEFTATLANNTANPNKTQITYTAGSLKPPAAVVGQIYRYTVPEAYEAERSPLTYLPVRLPDGFTYNYATREITGTAKAAGTLEFVIRARDNEGNFTDKVFSCAAELPNQAPTWQTLPTLNTAVGRDIDYTLPAAADADGESLIYTLLTTLPSGLTFDPATRRLTGRSAESKLLTLQFKATDPRGSAVTTELRIDIKDAGRLPIWASGNSIVDMYVETQVDTSTTPSKVRVRFPRLGNAISPNSLVRVSTSSVPSSPGGQSSVDVLSVQGADTEAVFSGFHKIPGIYTFRISSSDNFAKSDEFTVNLSATGSSVTRTRMTYTATDINKNIPCYYVAPENPYHNKSYSYVIPDAYSAERGGISYSIVGELPSYMQFDAVARRVTITPPAVGKYSFTVRATDSQGDYSDKTFTLEATLFNRAPTWWVPSNLTAGAGQYFYHQLPAASDADNDAVTYTGTVSPGLRFDPATRVISGYLNDGANSQAYWFFTATDAQGAKVTMRTVVEVQDSNLYPVWPDGNNTLYTALHVTADADYNVKAQFTRLPDGSSPIASYRVFAWLPDASSPGGFREVSSAPVSLTGAKGEASLGAFPKADAGYDFQLRAYDSRGQEITRTAKVRGWVMPNYWSGGVVAATYAKPALGSSLPEGQAGRTYSYTLPLAHTATGLASTYSVVSTLPKGLSFDPAARVLSGVPETAGTVDVVFIAYGDGGKSTYRSFSFSIAPAQVLSLKAATAPTLADAQPVAQKTAPSLKKTTSSRLAKTSKSAPSVLSASTAQVDAPLRMATLPATPASGITPSDPLAHLRPATVDDAQVIQHYYDAAGRLIGRVDGEGYVTEFVFDAASNKTQTIRYATAVTAGRSEAFSAVKARANTGGTLTSETYYTTRGLVAKSIDASGSTTAYRYDSMGRLIEQTFAQGSALQSQQVSRYNAFGELTGSLSGEGAHQLTGKTKPEDIDAVYASYGTRFVYDQGGRLVQQVDAAGNTSVNYYDAAGRLTHAVNARGEVSVTAYNTFGQSQNSLRYVKRLASTAGLSGGTLSSTTQQAIAALATIGQDLRTAYTYTACGQVATRTDGEGVVTKYDYYQTGELKTLTEAFGKAEARTTEYAYDRRGLTKTAVVDKGGLGLQTSYTHDAFGNRVGMASGTVANPDQQKASYQYDRRNVLTATTQDEGAGKLNLKTENKVDAYGRTTRSIDARGHGTWYVHDDLGRVRYVIDHEGGVSENRYDAQGRLAETVGYATCLNSTQRSAVHGSNTVSLATVQGYVTTSTDDRHAWFVYNRDGQLRYSLDGQGHVVEQRYNTLGRLTERLAYDKPIAIATAKTVDDIASALTRVAGIQAQQTSYAYDKVGRLDTLTDATRIHTEQYEYDGAGNKIGFTNKLGKTWTYAYDKTGRLLEETGPAVDEDHAMRLSDGSTSRRLVTRLRYDAFGNVLALSEGAVQRDAAGNELRDATGQWCLGDVRTTEYGYDALGRQVKTWAAGYYSIDNKRFYSEGERFYSEGGTRRYRLTSRVVYDQAGHAVVSQKLLTDGQAIAGSMLNHFEYKVYDAVGRVRFEVDAEYHVTEYQYDGNGNQTQLTRYANKLNTDVKVDGSTWTVGTALSAADIALRLTKDASNDRTVSTDYDALGRKTEVRQAAVSQFGVAVSGQNYTAAPTTRFAYNAFGQLAKQSVLRTQDGQPNAWADSYFAYDVLGRQVASVDAEGYLTRQVYDAFGNLSQKTEYAQAVSKTDYTCRAIPTAAETATAGSGPNRVMKFTYDAMNRQRVQTLVGQAYKLSDDRKSFDCDPHELTTTTEYDGLGRVKATKNALEQQQTISYDALGRVISQTGPEAKLAESNGTAGDLDALKQARRQQILFAYNAHGELVETRSGLESGPAHEWRYQWRDVDAAGNLVRSEAGVGALRSTAAQPLAGNAITDYKVDAFGRTMEERQELSAAYGGGVILNGQYGQNDTVTRRFSYDRVGRQTRTHTAGTLGNVSVTEAAAYNSFGEVVWKAVRQGDVDPLSNAADPRRMSDAELAGHRDSYYRYDQAGRLIESNDGDGIRKTYAYNSAGQQTQMQRHEGGRVQETVRVYDNLGRLTEERQPRFEADENGQLAMRTPTVNQCYDRWGNVVTRSAVHDTGTTSSANQEFHYRYNVFNQLDEEITPEVQVASAASGDSTAQRITRRRYYDALGRLIASRDGNGNVSTRGYDALGNLAFEQDATARGVEHVYNAHGQEVASRRYGEENQGAGLKRYNSATTHLKRYDRLGNLVQVSDVYSGQEQVLYTYRYDQRGRRVAVLEGGVEAVKGRYEEGGTAAYNQYDAFDRLIATRSAAGYLRTTGYDEKGRKTSEHDGSARQTWEYDAWRLQRYTDLGQRVHVYAYDGERLASETLYINVATAEVKGPFLGRKTYQHYANGLLKQVSVDTPGSTHMTKPLSGLSWMGEVARAVSETSGYAYNLAGQRVAETDTREETATGDIEFSKKWIDRKTGEILHPAIIGEGLTEILREQSVRRLDYDALGRLQGVALSQQRQENGYDYEERAKRHYVFLPWVTTRGQNALHISYGFDAEGNRVRSLSQFDHPVTGVREKRDDWAEFDGAGRVLISEAQRKNDGSLSLNAGRGAAISYDIEGRRAAASQRASSGAQVNERYEYSEQGYLTGVFDNDNETQKVRRLVDRWGRVKELHNLDVRYYPEDPGGDGNVPKVAPKMAALQADTISAGGTYGSVSRDKTTTTYNGDGQVLHQVTVGADNKVTSNSHYTGYDDAGNLLSHESISGNTTYKYSRRYLGLDSWKESAQTVMVDGKWQPGSSVSNYDAWGRLVSVSGTGGSVFTRRFWNSSEGLILRRENLKGDDVGRSQDHYYANGQVIGNLGTQDAKTGEYRAEFGDPYVPISDSYPATTPGSYVVQTGDTLSAVAQKVFGDSKLWYLIADANNLMAGDALTPGQSLKIPNVVSDVHNDAGTFKPYNQAEIVGDTTPSPVPPPPPKAKGCSGIAMVIMVVVAVVVTIFTAGAAMAVMGAAMQGGIMATGAAVMAGTAGFTAATVGAAFAGGVMGSVASQVVGKAMGVVDHFSLRGAVAGGLTSVATMGMGYLSQSGQYAGKLAEAGGNASKVSGFSNAIRESSTAARSIGQFMNGTWGGFAQGAVSYASSHAANKIAGVETSFSWAGAAAASLGAGINQAMGLPTQSQLQNGVSTGNFFKDWGGGFMNRAVTQSASRLMGVGGKQDWAQIAADSFGNAVGNSLVAAMKGAGSPPPAKPKPKAMNQPAPIGHADVDSGLSVDRSGPKFDKLPRQSLLTPPGTPEVELPADAAYWSLPPSAEEIALSYGSFVPEVLVRQDAESRQSGATFEQLKSFVSDPRNASPASQLLVYQPGVCKATDPIEGGSYEIPVDRFANIKREINKPFHYRLANSVQDAALIVGGDVLIAGKLASGSALFSKSVNLAEPLQTSLSISARGTANSEGASVVYRALTEADAISVASGRGLTAKAPNGTWTAAEHVANSKAAGGAAANSPWISTSRTLEVAKAYDGGNGVIAIDLSKVNSLQVEVWRAAPRVNGVEGLPYHRSIWAQEVTIYQRIPPQAILGPVVR